MIQLKRIIVHNFGSYGHAELDLQNRGFCLVSGQNNYIKDNALSNGSGKSFIWSAICYAITGETIGGIKSNLKNINIEEQECWVQLDFMYHKDIYSITRIIAPKSDLKITKNDTDLSGKGIRESEKRLQELLPELNKDLIASTIIIGQGMPNKFSSFSPSGRKELLEKLTKSDFMIEDLKMRIQTRQQELSSKLREFEDSILTNNTQLNNSLSTLNRLKENLATQQTQDFDMILTGEAAKINRLQTQLDSLVASIKEEETKVEATQTRLLTVSEEKAAVSKEELDAYTASHSKIYQEKVQIDFNVTAIEKEIKKLQSIKDTCPTCGQHLPNVNKPSTTQLEQQLAEVKAKAKTVAEELSKCEMRHQEYTTQIAEAFRDEIAMLNSIITSARQSIGSLQKQHNALMFDLESARSIYNKALYDKQNWDKYLARVENEIQQLESEAARLTNVIAITSISKEEYSNRLNTLKKMDQLVRRDFRGYLLTNIINYIDTRAKKYCNTVFGTRDLTLCLNGNALDITYCGKAFDGLSGGEKQRVDLILQLAIRDLLTSYLDLSANILVLDEITDFLDKQSCRAVMKLLEEELKTVESVFIISHHAEELELPIDSEIKVIKNAQGISELH